MQECRFQAGSILDLELELFVNDDFDFDWELILLVLDPCLFQTEGLGSSSKFGSEFLFIFFLMFCLKQRCHSIYNSTLLS